MKHLLVLLWGVGIAGCGAAAVSVPMSALNNSSETGTTTLTESGDQTRVEIAISVGTDKGAQGAHIHTGTCPGLGPIQYPLNPVVDGGSSTLVPVKLSDLRATAHVVNVHNSADRTVYVSCGAIP